MKNGLESTGKIPVADGLNGYIQAGYSANQITTMLQRVGLAKINDSRTKALRLHAIDLLTSHNDDFIPFRSSTGLSTIIENHRKQARMSEEDLTDEEVLPLLLQVGALLDYITPAQAAETMIAREDVHTGVQSVLDPRV